MNESTVFLLTFLFTLWMMFFLQEKQTSLSIGIITLGVLIYEFNYPLFLGVSFVFSYLIFKVIKQLQKKYPLAENTCNALAIYMSIILSLCVNYIAIKNHQTADMSLVSAGLLANSYRRNGIKATYKELFWLGIPTILFFISLRSISYLFPERVPTNEINQAYLAHFHWLILLSATLNVTYVIKHKKSFLGLGYIFLPYLVGIACYSFGQFLLILLLILLEVVFTKWVLRHSLLIGLTKYLFVLITSFICVFVLDYVVTLFGFQEYISGSLIIPLLVATVVNNLCLLEFRQRALNHSLGE